MKNIIRPKVASTTAEKDLVDWALPDRHIPLPKKKFLHFGKEYCPYCGDKLSVKVTEEYFNCDIGDMFGNHWRLFEHKCATCEYVHHERH